MRNLNLMSLSDEVGHCSLLELAKVLQITDSVVKASDLKQKRVYCEWTTMLSIIVSMLVLMEFISGIKQQDSNVTNLDFENDFGRWNISSGNWNRSTQQWIEISNNGYKIVLKDRFWIFIWADYFKGSEHKCNSPQSNTVLQNTN